MESKPWFLSKTIIAGIVGFLVSFVATWFHVSLTDIAPRIVNVTSQLIETVLAVASLVGVIVGRVKATQPVHLLAPTKTQLGGLSLALGLLSLGMGIGILTGCATVQTPTTSKTQTLINDAWTAANEFQTANNGQLITPATQSAALTLTHNSGDAAYATVVTSLFNQVLGAQIAAQASKVSPVAATNAVLAPGNVATTATTVAGSN